MPVVDFEKDMVILASLGVKGSGGYSIAVTGITNKKGSVLVDVESEYPGDCPVDSVITRPYAFATMPRFDKSVDFQEKVTLRDCSGTSTDAGTVIDVGTTIPFTTNVNSDYLSTSDRTARVHMLINDQATLEEEWAAYDPEGRNPLPEVDFNTNSVIVINMGIHGSTDYGMTITGITAVESYLLVDVVSDRPGYFCGAGAAMTRPYSFVTIPKSFDPIIVQDAIIHKPPCAEGPIKSETSVNPDKGSSVTFMNLVSSDYLGQSDRTARVYMEINDQTTFEEEWVAYDPEGRNPIPTIDFEKDMVIVINMGLQYSGGYIIGVAGVTEMENYVMIETKSEVPGKDCLVTNALTRPYTFVAIPKTNKEIVFQDNIKTTSCIE